MFDTNIMNRVIYLKILISGCLLGLACRYDGKSKPLSDDIIEKLKSNFDLVPVCPEQLGGLSTPRPPAEICGNKVINADNVDVTRQYNKGAEEVLALARLFGITTALMKEKSPACGFGQVYDGGFNKTLIDGNGVAADLLFKNGLEVYGESRIEEMISKYKK